MNKSLWKLTGVTLGAASFAMVLGAQAFAA